MDRPEHKQGNQAIFLVGPQVRISSWNSDCALLLGYAAADVFDLPLANLVAPDARPSLARAVAVSAQRQTQVFLEFVLADGGKRIFGLTLTPQWGPGSGLAGFSVTLRAAQRGSDAVTERERIADMPVHAMVDLLPGTFYVIDAFGRMIMWNSRVEQVTELSFHELETMSAYAMFREDERELIAAKVSAVFERNEEVLVEAGLLAKGGAVTPYMFTGARFNVAGQNYLCGMGLDLTERRRQEAQLRLHQRALHASSNGIYIVRRAGGVCLVDYVNPAFERITGHLAADVVGQDSRDMFGLFTAPGDNAAEHAAVRQALREGRDIRVTLRSVRKNGEAFWTDLTVAPVASDGEPPAYFIGVINDVTESKQRTSRLEHQINHDVLTGLPNRNLLWDRLEHAIHVAQRGKSLVAVVLIDLDKFKEINDSMGHEAGDDVLRVVARKMQAAVRDSDTVARLGGDEFVMVLANQPSPSFTLRMIERLRDDISAPFRIGTRDVSVEASMGVSVFPHDGHSVAELIQAADAAMYHAKNAGRNDVHFFSSDMKADNDSKRRLKEDLLRALDQREMFLVFQPKLSLRSGRIVGAEALLRWHHPTRGVLAPGEFVAAAEENGLIVPIGDWVARQVCAVLDELQADGQSELVIAMNVSFAEFSRRRYVPALGDLLASHAVAPGRFELEISEANLLKDIELTANVFQQVREAGIVLTVGDFGSGLASLKNLDESPVSCVKISKPYVQNIETNPISAKVARTIIGMGHLMHVDVLGEGVETQEQHAFLLANGCDRIQGNYVSAPVALAEFAALARLTNGGHMH